MSNWAKFSDTLLEIVCGQFSKQPNLQIVYPEKRFTIKGRNIIHISSEEFIQEEQSDKGYPGFCKILGSYFFKYNYEDKKLYEYYFRSRFEDKEVYVILKSFARPEDYGNVLAPGTEVKFQLAYFPATKNEKEKSCYLLIH